MTILVLGEDGVVRDSVCALLEAHQHEVVAARDPVMFDGCGATYDVAIGLPYDIADGEKMLAGLYIAGISVPVLLLVNDKEKVAREALQKAGALAVENKLMNEDELLDLIRKAVSIRHRAVSNWLC